MPFRDEEAEVERMIVHLSKAVVWMIWSCVAGVVLTILVSCAAAAWFMLYLGGAVDA